MNVEEKRKRAKRMLISLLVSEYLKRYGHSCELTAKAKQGDLELFISGLSPGTTLAKINQTTIRNFEKREAARGMKPATIVRRLSTLKHFFGKIEREYLIRSPFEDYRFPKIPKTKPESLSREQRKTLRVNLPPHSVIRAALEIALLTGLRASEITSLRMWQLDPSALEFKTVYCKAKKTRNIPFPAELLTNLAGWMVAREMILEKHFLKHGMNYYDLTPKKKSEFPLLVSTYKASPINPSSYSISTDYIRSRLCRLGKELGFRANLHKSRKTYATTLYKETGHDIRLVSKMLGHSSTVVTENYLGISDEDEQKAIEIIGGVLAA